MKFDENDFGFETVGNTNISEQKDDQIENNDYDLSRVLSENDSEIYEKKRVKWSEFVEVSVVNFFNEYKMERLSVEDGNGNKAKLSRTKDGGIKIEYFSTMIL